jgi:hypothetical protein
LTLSTGVGEYLDYFGSLFFYLNKINDLR